MDRQLSEIMTGNNLYGEFLLVCQPEVKITIYEVSVI